jgi:hypothetical protein
MQRHFSGCATAILIDDHGSVVAFIPNRETAALSAVRRRVPAGDAAVPPVSPAGCNPWNAGIDVVGETGARA